MFKEFLIAKYNMATTKRVMTRPTPKIVMTPGTSLPGNRALSIRGINQIARKLTKENSNKFTKFFEMIFCIIVSFQDLARNALAGARRNSSPQPPPSAAPERILEGLEIALAISQKMVSSHTVKIHHNLTFRNNTNFFGGGAKRRPLISPRQILPARRAQARLAAGQDEIRLPCDFNSVSDLLCPKLLTKKI